MKAQEILATLKKLGKPQTAAIYKRYLSGDNVCGVLTSEIAKLQKHMGYGILGRRLKNDSESVTDADAEKILATIEKDIHRSPNWARYAMNSALISIGVFKPALQKKAIEAARRIGKVEVDHGETYCKKPDAVSYIKKASKRKRCP